jgi:DNA polymerase III subunit delta
MYKREFEALLKAKKIPKALFLYGACEYQNNYLAQELLRLLDVCAEEKMLMYFDEYHFASAKNFIAQSSLFGDRNILIIKTDKAIPAKELETLVELCGKNESSYLICQFFGEDKKATPSTKAFEKASHAQFVRLFKAELGDALSLLEKHAFTIGLRIDRYVLQHLYLVHAEDLSLCINECEKLSLLERDVSIQDIDTLVYGLGTVSMEHFMAKLFEKKDISEVFERLIEGDGMEEMRVLNAIESHLCQLFLFHSYIKLHGSFDAKAILGYALPTPIATQRSNQSIKIDLKTYQTLFELLLNTEYTLKKLSNVDKNTQLLSSLIKLQSYL